MAKGKVKNYPLRLTQDEWEWLQSASKETGKPISQVIRDAIKIAQECYP